MKNNYLYQGNYAEYDEDIGWHDFALRSYDAQLGRFWQPDPYDEFASGYTGMGNDPVNMVDPSGGFSVPGAVIGGVAGFIAGGSYALAKDKNPVTGALFGAAGGALLGGLVGDLNFGGATQAVDEALKSGIPSMVVSGANFAVNTINYEGASQSVMQAVYNQQQHPKVIDNTKQALDHYFNGNNEPVNIGTNTTFSLLASPEFKKWNSNILSGNVKRMNWHFSVNMTYRVFHIGNTNVDYAINCKTQYCTVVYKLFVRDGFWDVDFIQERFNKKYPKLSNGEKPDGIGPNFERFRGHPYPYNPVIIKFTFLNPGYK